MNVPAWMHAVALGGAVILGVTVLASPEGAETTLAAVLASHGMTADAAADIPITEREETELAGVSIDTVEARAGNRRLTARILQDVGPRFADQYTTDTVQSVTVSFTQQTAPYAAVPVPHVDCTDGFRPTVSSRSVNGRNRTLIELYADKSRSYTCLSDEAMYRAAVLVLYCPDAGNVVEVEAFEPRDGAPGIMAWVSAIRCLEQPS